SDYRIDFTSILKSHFDFIYRHIQPDQVFQIEQFTRLRSLALPDVKTSWLQLILSNLYKLEHLRSLTLVTTQLSGRIYERSDCLITFTVENRLNCLPLSRLQQLTIANCSSDYKLEVSPHYRISTNYCLLSSVSFPVMEELLRSLIKFGGTLNEDVVKWLHDMEEIFDRVQLRPSNKFMVTQSYFNIPDLSTFQIEIVKAFQLSTPSKVSLISTIPQQEKENENSRVDLINDNQIKSFEALENKCLRRNEQGYESPILVNINGLDLKV
ncbi:unnamed protein product, partial [Rotaria socialis]